MENKHTQPGERRAINSGIFSEAQQNIIRASGVNLSQAVEVSEMQYYNERPMMLDTWTQTSNADLGLEQDYLRNAYIEEQKQREKSLLEKIRILKAELRAHSEMLTQMQSLHTRSIQHQQHSLVVNPVETQEHRHYSPEQRQKSEESPSAELQLCFRPSCSKNARMYEEVTVMSNGRQEQPDEQQLLHNNTQLQHIAQEMHEGAESTMQPNDAISHNAPSTIINNAQEARSHNVNYTIIADGDGDSAVEPIEIEIAEDGAQNLNCSADSERLEICLSEQQQTEANVKYEVDNEQNPSVKQPLIQHRNRSSPSVNPIVTKRVKISGNLTQFPEAQFHESQVFLQEAPQQSQNQSYEAAQPQPLRPLQTNRKRASLLKLSNKPQRRSNKRNTMARDQSEAGKTYCSIGPNNTRVATDALDDITWTSASVATRKLMSAIFDRETLATHSMTGKPSPAFKGQNKPLKKRLDPLAIQDIIFAVSRKCQVPEKEVRCVITTKCADENKMWKLDLAKIQKKNEQDKENVG